MKMAYQRAVGTLTGALFGLITIVLEMYILPVYDNELKHLSERRNELLRKRKEIEATIMRPTSTTYGGFSTGDSK